MEPEGSLRHSQVPATSPYPEPARSSSCPHIAIPEDPSYYYPPIYALVFQVALSPRFPHQNPIYNSPLYVLHAPPISFSIFISQTILGEQYRSLSSSLCSFLHCPVTSSLLGPNIWNFRFLWNAAFRPKLALISFRHGWRILSLRFDRADCCVAFECLRRLLDMHELLGSNLGIETRYLVRFFSWWSSPSGDIPGWCLISIMLRPHYSMSVQWIVH